MRADELKKILQDNTSFIVDILEECGVHNIKVLSERIQGARPDGDNPTSIQIITKTSDLTSICHTDSSYKGGDIFSLVGHLKGLEFIESFNLCCNLIGVESGGSYKERPKLFGILDMLFGNSNKHEVIENIKLDDKVLEEFIISPHTILTKQGVSIDTQIKFSTGYDIIDNRLITPIRDEDGDLVTIKGRTLNDNYKIDGIAKFIAYYPYNASQMLFGLYENKLEIYSKNEAIIVETEKGCMQAHSIGVKNVLALSKKKISRPQSDKLLSLQCPLVFGFDKDVSPIEIISQTEEFAQFVDVYIIYDFDDLLGEKDSPFDKGKEVWYDLYDAKIKLSDFKEWYNDKEGISS